MSFVLCWVVYWAVYCMVVVVSAIVSIMIIPEYAMKVQRVAMLALMVGLPVTAAAAALYIYRLNKKP